MELAKSFSSDLAFLQKKMAAFLAEAVVLETLLAAQRSLVCLFSLMRLLLKDADALPELIGNEQRFPYAELHKRGTTEAEAEAKDGSDTEDDDEDDEDAEEPDDDAGDEDFSGEEGGEDDEEGDPEDDPAANGNQGSDDDDDDDEEEDDDNDDDDDEEEEEEDDEDEDKEPPAKKRK